MTPKFFKKSSQGESKDLATPEIPGKAGSMPESREILLPKERKHIKKEVLEEVSEAEEPVKNRPTPQTTKPTEPATTKSESLLMIEDTLAEDLEDAYFKMDPELRQKFKAEGEKMALKIEKILQKTKVKAKDIFKLIYQWLKIIPGVNKFFIKQEAKIKTDKIMKLK